MTSRVLTLVLGGTLLGACATGSGGVPTVAPQTGVDAGATQTPPPAIDASASDTSPTGDAGTIDPTPFDAGTIDPGPIDAGTPVTPVDSGTDAGPPPTPDAGPPPRPCTPLPTTGTITIDGSTSGAATWQRPNAAVSCPATTRASGAIPYAEHVLCNQGAAGTFELVVDSGADAYLVVYDGDSMPSDPLACRDGDDDSADPLLPLPLVGGLAVPAGGRVLVVVTGYGASDYGPYSLYVSRE
ncbi:hypothetical protein [Sandaracinus amylolyticus]|uniref:hypothetical protein n=1 Tax=Sandaracinus amylolyticus TaxID=927083 RepID=UPI001F3A58AA|nr:hypothetical protein [Sandaracinus amylolyticus]UJR85690.1 Hypothetical protein I5071_77700 [Sandaracinus amylolyticus]